MAGKQFFATKADMEPGLRAFEAQWRVKYVETGFRPSSDVETYDTAFDLPNLGFSAHHSIIVSPEYLMFPKEAGVVTRPVRQHDGKLLYLTEWKENPSAVIFRPGGWYNNQALIGGSMGMYSSSEDVLAYYRPFARALAKGFTVLPDVLRYKWWVGPEALTLLDAGVRLVTRDLHMPNTYDLKRP